ncbi:MAG: HAD family hydrolase [Euryarchaeota archaeon]|nr:HAD family hydrolase [Euryarchaeota archaeon]
MRCLIFDVDDTIVEYVEFDYEEWYREVGERAARALKVPLTIEEWRAMTSGKLSRRYPEKFGVSAETFWKKVDAFNLQYRVKMHKAGRIRLYDDAKIIPRLEGVKIAWSASSTECVKYVLKVVGALDWFDAIYGKDYQNYAFLEQIKPYGGLLKEIKERHNCEDCYVIGDSERDMAAAQRAGCERIRIKRSGKRGPFTVSSLEELLERL